MLVKTDKASDFSTFMKRINLAYFHHYNQEYGWVGHFWQDRFKSQAVGKDAYFIQCGKYIELNPVRKGIVIDPYDYAYSSYRYYAAGQANRLITPDFIYEEMRNTGIERQTQYQKLIIGQVIEDSYKKSAWGSNYQRYNERNKSHKYQERHDLLS